jgi:hypothetical protein
MTNQNEDTISQKDITEKFEGEVLKSDSLEEYRRVMDFFHMSLYRLQTSLFIVDQIEKFPFDLFTTIDDRIFLSHVVAVFMDDALMTVYKLVVDNDYSYTIQQLKNKIIPQDRREEGFIKDEYKNSFSDRIEALYFDQKTGQIRGAVNDLRNERIGHSTRDWVLGNSTTPLLELARFRQLIKATQELFNALCFNTHRTLLPISYDPAVIHPNYGDNRPDIEKILDFLASESLILNMPERETYPGAWAEQRKILTSGQIEQINHYRRKFKLPEV